MCAKPVRLATCFNAIAAFVCKMKYTESDGVLGVVYDRCINGCYRVVIIVAKVSNDAYSIWKTDKIDGANIAYLEKSFDELCDSGDRSLLEIISEGTIVFDKTETDAIKKLQDMFLQRCGVRQAN